jgi:AcrR family transcriptional regulator
MMAVTSRTRGGASARGDVSRETGRSGKSRAGRAGLDGAGHGAAARDGQGDVLSRERVGDLQRARILTAMTELVRERGVRAVTVAHVVGRSGVSRRTFYELFEDREDCLLGAFENALQRAREMVLPAYEAAGDWQERTRAGLEAWLEFLDAEPAMGGLCVVDAHAAEGRVIERRARAVGALVDAVHEGGRARESPAARGRAVAKEALSGRGRARANGRDGAAPGARAKGGAATQGPSARPPRIIAEGAVGAVLAVLHARMTAADPKPLSGLLGPLMSMIVLPYLGPDAAEQELARCASRRRVAPAPRRRGDPLRELDMRLTYRTVRVLIAVSELGGRGSNPSSRQVADASGVADQGQMSKLLWRLESLGLIVNEAPAPGRGEPNAWSLTTLGREVEQAIRAQTGS